MVEIYLQNIAFIFKLAFYLIHILTVNRKTESDAADIFLFVVFLFGNICCLLKF